MANLSGGPPFAEQREKYLAPREAEGDVDSEQQEPYIIRTIVEVALFS
jgi:hypothetical protein